MGGGREWELESGRRKKEWEGGREREEELRGEWELVEGSRVRGRKGGNRDGRDRDEGRGHMEEGGASTYSNPYSCHLPFLTTGCT